MQTIVKFGVEYIHTYIYMHTCIYVPTFKHYIHKYVYTYITPIYTCILTKHEYVYKYILPYVDMYIHIHKYKYVNAYMLHTYYNKPYVLTNVNTCIKISYYISYDPFILHNIQIYIHCITYIHIYIHTHTSDIWMHITYILKT